MTPDKILSRSHVPGNDPRTNAARNGRRTVFDAPSKGKRTTDSNGQIFRSGDRRVYRFDRPLLVGRLHQQSHGDAISLRDFRDQLHGLIPYRVRAYTSCRTHPLESKLAIPHTDWLHRGVHDFLYVRVRDIPQHSRRRIGSCRIKRHPERGGWIRFSMARNDRWTSDTLKLGVCSTIGSLGTFVRQPDGVIIRAQGDIATSRFL
jgi:hypothetical protein